MRPRICELFDTKTTREYTVLDNAIKEEWLANSEPFDPVLIPRGIKHPVCYLCHERVNQVHWFYHRLCFTCGEISYAKRHFTKDLTGYRAIVTGGRVKLGYQIALKLLRAGAAVAITSRNWENALTRYQDEPDYDVWKERLHVCKINFDLLRVDELLDQLDAELNRIWPDHPGIDIVIHNAAQTIFEVAEAPFVKAESKPTETLKRKREDDADTNEQRKYTRHKKKEKSPDKKKTRRCRRYPPVDWVENVFPEIDRYQRKIDERETNTWNARFGTVRPEEAKQVLIANAWAPFVLNQFLLPRLQASRNKAYIIHVHAREGHFNVHKTLSHMHTNMAKAALCMMTRCLVAPVTTYASRQAYQKKWKEDLPWSARFSRPTTADENTNHRTAPEHPFIKEITIHGVDPGWFSVDEYTRETRVNRNLFFSVIDEIDAAARVLYPIFIDAPSFPGTWRHYVPLLSF